MPRNNFARRIKRAHKKTAEVLQSMLKENTGRHFLDSGGAYGRHWEQNQARDFAAEPAVHIKATVWEEDRAEISVTLNVYHWLLERVVYDGRLDRFMRSRGDESEGDLDDIRWFVKHLRNKGHDVSELGIVNTYNNEDALSQTIQYWHGYIDRDPYVLLQIHGGCDVRGGYTRPRAFRTNDDSHLYGNADITLYCQPIPPDERQLLMYGPMPHDPHRWQSDNAGYSYSPGEPGHYKDLADYPPYAFEATAGEAPKRGFLSIDTETETAFCPVCTAPLTAF
jgi:hypothetical protein